MKITEKTPSINLDEIWSDDLLDRRREAELLVGYIESLADRPGYYRSNHSYTISVDAGYGTGKTFFLKRLACHLGINHPVAFIDAWADDLADQPLVALTATLKAALDPYMAHGEVRSRWEDFTAKTGRVAKIAGLGLVKRSLGFFITQRSVDALEDVIKDVSEEEFSTISDSVKDIGTGLSEDVFDGLSNNSDMNKQISDYERARKSIIDMKKSLSQLINEIKETNLKIPVVIIIDELDRCRPPYAIKLLEEVKHLFDVPGLVFIFGMHGEQLGYSVSGAYGPQFDGNSYLRRFFNRRYSLAEPNNEKLVDFLIRDSGLSNARFSHPALFLRDGRRTNEVNVISLICIYVEIFRLSAREINEIVDILETATQAVSPDSLILPYIVPMIIGYIRGLPAGDVPKWPDDINLTFKSKERADEIGIVNLFNSFRTLSNLSNGDLSDAYNRSENDYATGLVAMITFNQTPSNPLAYPRNYPRLISSVSRFSRP
jgi:hypothetical protein